MKRHQAGFGLLETLLAMALAIMLLAGASGLFVAVHRAWSMQGAAALLQDDARLVLQRIAEDVRMAGMFGCLRLEPADFKGSGAEQAFAQPVAITATSLTLVGAELPGMPGPPEWTVLSDCRSWAQVMDSQHQAGASLFALLVRRQVYEVRNGSLFLTTGKQRSSLVDNVKALQVTRVEAGEGDRLDIRLTLYDATFQLEVHQQVSVALRNLGGAT